MERERLKFEWGAARWGDRFEYLPHNRDFWRVWGKRVPECECPGRPAVTLVELRPTPPHKNGHRNGEFKLHMGDLTAPVYSQLRSRLSVMLFREIGDIEVVDADLESLAAKAGKGSKAVLNKLRAFEATLRPSRR